MDQDVGGLLQGLFGTLANGLRVLCLISHIAVTEPHLSQLIDAYASSTIKSSERRSGEKVLRQNVAFGPITS